MDVFYIWDATPHTMVPQYREREDWVDFWAPTEGYGTLALSIIHRLGRNYCEMSFWYNGEDEYKEGYRFDEYISVKQGELLQKELEDLGFTVLNTPPPLLKNII